MSNFQLNPGTPNASGRAGGNLAQSPWFLILFGVPFLVVGVVALVAGISHPKMENVSVAYIVGGVFACVGLGIIIAGFCLRKKAKQISALQAQHPDQPWLWRADWAEGKIKASTMAQPFIMLIIGVAFCVLGGASTYHGLPEVWQKHNYAALLVLLFPLVGIGLLVAFIAALRSQRRFGKCFFEPAQVPVPLGGVLEGMIQTGKPLKLEHELNLTFSCIHRVTTGSGKSRSTNDYVLWQTEKIYSAQASLPEPEPGHTGIPVHFKLPADQVECFSRGDESVLWRLEAKSKLRGPHFHAVFEVPVFKVAGAEIADAAETDDSDPTASLQAPIEEIRREQKSRIKVFDGPNGRDFYFPPARNALTAFFMTLAMFVFNGAAVFLYHRHAPIIFPIVFGLVGVLMIFGTFSAWFKSSRVTIDSTAVHVTNDWLIFTRTREFPANDVARFATRTEMQSGSQVFFDIRLIPRGSDEKFAADKEKFQETFQPGKVPNVNQVVAQFRKAAGPSGTTVASNIAGAAEADWLVAEMNKALHQTQPGAGYSPNEGMGAPKAGAGPAKAAMTSMLILIGFALACGAGYWFWQQTHSIPPTPQSAESPKPAETPKSAAPKPAQPQPAVLDVAFSSFGSYSDYETNGWLVEADGHADWFVSKSSGRLRAIELKIEPASQPTKGLFVSIFEDRGGVPGRALEMLSVGRLVGTNSAGWLVLDSRKQPALEAGVKYWVWARSPAGTWYWHFNNQNLMQEAMHSPQPRTWATAGSNNVCAFSVVTERNQSSP